MVQTIFARRLTLGEDSPLYWTDPELPVGKFLTGTIFRGNTGAIGVLVRKYLPFVVAMSLSVIVLFTPESGVPSSPPGTDKVVHCLLFALLAFTGLLARPRWILLALVGYAALSEVLQQLITPLHRSGDVLDALTDVVGIALGWGVAALVARRVSARASR